MGTIINAKNVIQKRLAQSFGLDKYDFIMNSVRKVNVSQDSQFQKVYNGFYIVRRNIEWRTAYYRLFESLKYQPPSFEFILNKLFEKTGNIEASFSSKMLATLNPEMPIWDQYVLQSLNLSLNGKNRDEKILNAIKMYEQICGMYSEYLKTEESIESLTIFDTFLPEYSWISPVKKIDCLLWGSRGNLNEK